MLGKLLKYDIKFGSRPFLIMAGGMILASILVRVLDLDVLSGMGLMFLFPVILISIFIACVVLVYQNFSRNLLSNEGYFMMTLPVKRYKFIISKLITSMMWFNFMVFIGLISGAIMLERNLVRYSNFGMPAFTDMIITLFVINLFVLNAILVLYLLAVASNVSIGGKKFGWTLGAACLIVFSVTEVLFITHIASPLLNNLNLWFVWFEYVDGNTTTLRLFLHDNYLWRDLLLDMGQFPTIMTSIDIASTLSIIIFSIAAFFIIEHCLKKRVDLQ